MFVARRGSKSTYRTARQKFRSYSYNFCKNVFLQRGSNLGKKIWNLKNSVRGNFIVLGSDIPFINFEDLYNAFEILKSKDIVIGPTYDNGFWLIGFSNRKSIMYPFKEIRWSTKHSLYDLVRNIEKNGNSVNYCKKLRDIDIIDDYCEYSNKV